METQRSDGVRPIKSSSLEFNNNTGRSSEVDTLVWNVCEKRGNDIQKLSETRNVLGNKVLTQEFLCSSSGLDCEVVTDTNPTTRCSRMASEKEEKTTPVKRNLRLFLPL